MVIQSAKIPKIHNYAEALARYNAVTPYSKGENKGKRPIGENRRYKHCLIEHTPETGEVAATLYGYEVVRWLPNGEVLLSLSGYNTVSTRQFINEVTAYPCVSVKGITYVAVCGKYYTFPNDTESLRIKDGFVLNPTQEFIYKVDRKGFAEVKQRFAPFREYVANMGKVLTGITKADIDAVFMNKRVSQVLLPHPRVWYFHSVSKPKKELAFFLDSVRDAQEADSLEEFYALFLRVGVSALTYSSHLKAFVVPNHGYPIQTPEIGNIMLAFFDEALKYHFRDEIFTKQEVPIGTKVSNTNRKYFA